MRRTVIVVLAGLLAGPAAAAGTVSVELNRLEPTEDACRAWLVIENGAGAFDALTLDFVIFDADGVVADRLAVDLAPLAAGKTAVKAFDLAGRDCARLGRFLMNGVLGCEGVEKSPRDCAGLVRPRAREGLSFIE